VKIKPIQSGKKQFSLRSQRRCRYRSGAARGFTVRPASGDLRPVRIPCALRISTASF